MSRTFKVAIPKKYPQKKLHLMGWIWASSNKGVFYIGLATEEKEDTAEKRMIDLNAAKLMMFSKDVTEVLAGTRKSAVVYLSDR